MGVSMRAGRTDRMDEAVHQPQQREARNESDGRYEPAGKLGDLGQNPEQRDSRQQSAAERDDAPRKRGHRRKPNPYAGARKSQDGERDESWVNGHRSGARAG